MNSSNGQFSERGRFFQPSQPANQQNWEGGCAHASESNCSVSERVVSGTKDNLQVISADKVIFI